MTTDFANQSPEVIAAGLLDRIRNRNTIPDPANPGQFIPRPRPFIDAVKNGLAKMVEQFGPQLSGALMPILLEKLPGLLEGLFGGVKAASADDAAFQKEIEEGVKYLAAQAPVQAAGVSDELSKIGKAISDFIVAMIGSMDPADAMTMLLAAVQQLFALRTKSA